MQCLCLPGKFIYRGPLYQVDEIFIHAGTVEFSSWVFILNNESIFHFAHEPNMHRTGTFFVFHEHVKLAVGDFKLTYNASIKGMFVRKVECRYYLNVRE